MKRGTWALVAALAVGIAVAAAVAVASGGGGDRAAAKPKPAQHGSPSAKVERVKVEGHWKIEVRNPDGRLVTVRRFHNDPTNANSAIATILARAYTPSYWWITLGSNTGAGPACLSSGTPVFCRLIDANDLGAFAASPNSFKTLTTSNSGVQTSITLTGSMNAQRDGDVNTVATNLSVCSNTVAPSTACGTSSFWPFTQRTLGSPISLVTGQQLLVTVTLTFT
jgi:hypothetical protein